MFKNDQNGEITYYNWQGNNIIAEINESGRNKVYTRGLGIIKSNDGLYYLQNGHGDISALVNGSGTVKTRYTYDAFGNQSCTGSSSNNPFGYCGEYKDSLLNSIYLRARRYTPSTGRFYTEDPARDGFNWYVYCGNNPVMFIDPTGKYKKGDEKLDSSKQKILNGSNMDGKGGLSQSWKLADDGNDKLFIESVADFIRGFNTNNINRIVVVVNAEAAAGFGHTAVMLINEKNQAVLFSYFSENGDASGPGQTRIMGYNNEDEWKNILYWNKVYTNIVTSSGTIEKENYSDTLCLTIEHNKGENAFNKIADMFVNPGTYNLLSNNCNTHVRDIVGAAGKFYDYSVVPNNSFSNTYMYYNYRRVWNLNNSITPVIY